MGIFQGTQKDYYEGSVFGGYQFTSLEDVIDYFMAVYIGEDKIIPKAKRMDVAFHAQRGLQELSFDTFKSIKSQQIELPPSLKMMLPHDYVNYTRVMFSDDAGIKHPLYPTRHTQNPFEVKQNSDGSYFFGEEQNIVINNDFDDALSVSNWSVTRPGFSSAWDSFRQNYNPVTNTTKYYVNRIIDKIELSDSEIAFSHHWNHDFGINGGSRAYAVWQKIDVKDISTIKLIASATSGAQKTSGATLLCDYGVVRVGVTITDPLVGWPTRRVKTGLNPATTVISPAVSTAPPGDPDIGTVADFPSPNNNPKNFELGYVEWTDGSSSQKEIESINVAAYDEVWVWVTSFSPWTSSARTILSNGPNATPAGPARFNGGTTQPLPAESENNEPQINTVDSVSVVLPGQYKNIVHQSTDNNSSTWNNYKSHTPSENNINDYQDYQNDIYWPNEGKRYGLDPAHSQVNGSFYIDERMGNIHFSSNISGKTVILDYISDSLGTEAEMKVHKFAEEAMYKYIMHAIISTSSYGQGLVPRLTKEKFAAIRKAKLRLSNIKLEELTQILRGKSKQIKH